VQDWGESIGLWANGHSDCCIVMLGCSVGGTSFLPSLYGREFKEEEFIVTVGYKCLNLVKCTLCS
jgi:hypothetical protein